MIGAGVIGRGEWEPVGCSSLWLMCVGGVVVLGWIGYVSLGLHSGRCSISLGCSRKCIAESELS